MKKILLRFVALTLACLAFVGITNQKVSATEAGFGAYSVGSQSTEVANWSFIHNLPSSSKTYATGDTINGIVLVAAGKKTGTATTDDGATGIKSDGNGLSIYGGGIVGIPVPSADAAGTINLWCTGTTTGRGLAILNADLTVDETKDQIKVVPGQTYTFDSTNVVTSGTTYYVPFQSIRKTVEGVVTDTDSGESKIGFIKVSLTSTTTYTATSTTDIGYQVGTSAVRIIGCIGVTDYTTIDSISIQVSQRSSDGKTNLFDSVTCTTVYDSLTAFGEESALGDVADEFYYAFTITNFPTDQHLVVAATVTISGTAITTYMLF